MAKYGKIISNYKTKHGRHYRVLLNKPIEVKTLKTFVKVLDIRHECCDDPQRICFDLFKYAKGFEIVDILFTKKWKGWE